ncbi:LmbE family protein [Mahella australiensis 50-1 BON]|uniref:LmbE family protein n=1 Tax=Mahella australiensis (strain DSM 15567 / CIP 107919 / 50-1 BON) TaxID=697281 RepID=F4A0C3_MAHA5|nr:LmbE family protein [Mahella australiensis 50-1 BON]
MLFMLVGVIVLTSCSHGKQPDYTSIAISKGKRILVIAPHPDDETLGVGGTIYQAVKNSDDVKVVIVTSGDSFTRAAEILTKHPIPGIKDYIRLGYIRHSESRKALESLGVKPDNIIFLGYADTSLRFLWDSFWDKPHVSGDIRSAYSPYDDIYQLKVPYMGQALETQLANIIEQYKPTDIYYPSTMDAHPDHWAAGAFTEYAAYVSNYTGELHAYLIHHKLWPSLWAMNKNAPEMPPADIKNIGGFKWEEDKLSDDAIDAKLQAVKKYKTQIDVMAPFMYGFIRNSESFMQPQVSVIPELTAVFDVPGQITQNKFMLIKNIGDNEFKRIEEPSANIVQLNSASANNTLYIALKLHSKPEASLSYEMHIRLLYPMSVKRIDLLYKKGKWQYENKAGNSIVINDINGNVYDKVWLCCNLPISTPRYLYINADISKGDKMIDHLPLYMFKLQAQ